ncbi:hypothetical protein [Clostridium sp. OS1-26]|uniref:hypothetical protein n=1 Tax=Clostridium sp. OS1-26 TaxID=3070681 RepID=UPI0027DF4B8B|nr:hypothetical protein [Clostridium sp. OS1-26]WML34419.1 hypothetical protein RCG18_24555 [Clostridium sp. OS1-26]
MPWIFWSPDQTQIGYIGNSGITSIINFTTMRVPKINQITVPGFIDWAPDSRKMAYLSGCRSEKASVIHLASLNQTLV